MTFKRINEGTVQCIVSGSDLAEYGLTFTDIMERGEKSEIFIRNMLESARREAGFSTKSPGVSMQITPLQNDSLIVTLSDSVSNGLIGLLAHIKEVISEGIPGLSEEDSEEVEERVIAHFSEGLEPEDLPASVRVVAFDSIGEAVSFSSTAGCTYGLKSSLYKSNGKYFLVMEKGRMSWERYNRLSSDATEYGLVGVAGDDRLAYLYEHGDLLIKEKALQTLRSLDS
ncbi:MAG: adaptor protein MecA [Lachnospiraceae bacterium]|nr:adaptor protein MecA [Lachnospiraceae bacterium]